MFTKTPIRARVIGRSRVICESEKPMKYLKGLYNKFTAAFFVGPKSKNWECLKQLEFIQAGMVIYKCLFKVDIYDRNLQKNIMPSSQKRYRD